MTFDVAAFMQELEFHGEQKVREMLATDKFRHHSIKEQLAQNWLRSKEEARSTEAAKRAEEREEESLSISREALRISRSANTIAKIAIAFSAITAIIVVIIEILKSRTYQSLLKILNLSLTIFEN